MFSGQLENLDSIEDRTIFDWKWPMVKLIVRLRDPVGYESNKKLRDQKTELKRVKKRRIADDPWTMRMNFICYVLILKFI